LWIASEIEVYKYVQEREAASLPVLQAKSSNLFTLGVTCDPSKLAFKDQPVAVLYDQPLTVEVAVPATWMSFQVKQGAAVAKSDVKSREGQHFARFQVLPNLPPATVSRI
jgi:hypothetical protein